jgi:hypothetical protein
MVDRSIRHPVVRRIEVLVRGIEHLLARRDDRGARRQPSNRIRQPPAPTGPRDRTSVEQRECHREKRCLRTPASLLRPFRERRRAAFDPRIERRDVRFRFQARLYDFRAMEWKGDGASRRRRLPPPTPRPERREGRIIPAKRARASRTTRSGEPASRTHFGRLNSRAIQGVIFQMDATVRGFTLDLWVDYVAFTMRLTRGRRGRIGDCPLDQGAEQY